MPQSLQAKLLRFLQQRTIERIGGRAEIPVDVRVVCATNKNLRQAMATGAFREDLYYRISEITIDIPPLREREGGRLLLAQYLLNKFAKQQGRVIKGFTDDAHDAIETYAWPGNVREMENKIKAGVIMAEGKFVTADRSRLERGDEPAELESACRAPERRDARDSPGARARRRQHLAHRGAARRHAADALRPHGEVRYSRRGSRSAHGAERRSGGCAAEVAARRERRYRPSLNCSAFN